MVEIRTATASDIPILCQLIMTVQNHHRRAMPHRYRAIQPTDAEIIGFFETVLSTEGNTIFIAEHDSNSVGYVLLEIRDIPDHVLVFGRRNCHIDQMSVNEDVQGQGIGKQLMQHAIEFAKSQQAETITLGVTAFNQDAIEFYKKCGFGFGSHRMSLTIDE